MKIKTSLFQNRGKSEQRGAGLVQVLLLVIGFCLGYQYIVSSFNEWRGAEWTEERLTSLAAKVVTTSRNAELAGIPVVDPYNLDLTLDRLAVGATAASGPYAGQTFAVPDLAAGHAREKLKDYLVVEEGRLAVLSDEERLSR